MRPLRRYCRPPRLRHSKRAAHHQKSGQRHPRPAARPRPLSRRHPALDGLLRPRAQTTGDQVLAQNELNILLSQIPVTFDDDLQELDSIVDDLKNVVDQISPMPKGMTQINYFTQKLIFSQNYLIKLTELVSKIHPCGAKSASAKNGLNY